MDFSKEFTKHVKNFSPVKLIYFLPYGVEFVLEDSRTLES